jgi:hypothetical protein
MGKGVLNDIWTMLYEIDKGPPSPPDLMDVLS